MTTEQFLEMKEGYIFHLKRFIQEVGGLPPHITVIGTPIKRKEEDPEFAIIQIPIPEEFMVDDDHKQEFVDDVIPTLAKMLQEKFTISAVAFASEAWLRMCKPEEFKHLKDYHELPIKKEVLFCTIDYGKDYPETFSYEIKRHGKKVNKDGELTDQIDLFEMDELKNMDGLDGRFAHLYKKFTTPQVF